MRIAVPRSMGAKIPAELTEERLRDLALIGVNLLEVADVELGLASARSDQGATGEQGRLR